MVNMWFRLIATPRGKQGSIPDISAFLDSPGPSNGSYVPLTADDITSSELFTSLDKGLQTQVQAMFDHLAALGAKHSTFKLDLSVADLITLTKSEDPDTVTLYVRGGMITFRDFKPTTPSDLGIGSPVAPYKSPPRAKGGFDANLDAIKVTIQELRLKQTQLEEQLREAEQKLEDRNKETDILIQRLEKQVSKISQELADVQKQLELKTTECQRHEETISQLQSELLEIKAARDSASDSVVDLGRKLEQAATEKAQLAENLRQKTADFDTQSSRLTDQLRLVSEGTLALATMTTRATTAETEAGELRTKLSDLQEKYDRETADLQKQAEETATTLSTEQGVLKDLREKFELAQSEHKSTLDSLKEEMASLEDAAKQTDVDHSAAIQVLETSISQKTVAFDQQKTELDTQVAEVERLTRLSDGLSQKLESLAKEKEQIETDLGKEIARLQDESARLQSDHKAALLKLRTELTGQYDLQTAELETMSTRATTAETEADGLRTKLSDLQERYDTDTRALREQAEATATTLSTEQGVLKDLREKFELAQSEHKSTLDSLKEEMASLEDAAKQTDVDHSAAIQLLETSISQKTDAFNKQKTELDTQVAEVERLTRVSDGLSQKLEGLAKEKEQLETDLGKEITRLQDESAHLKSKHEEAIKDLEARRQALETDLATLKQTLEGQIEALQRDLQAEKERYIALEDRSTKEIASLKRSLEQAREKQVELEHRIAECEGIIRGHEKTLSAASAKVSSLRSQRAAAYQRIAELEKNVSEQSRVNQGVRREYESAKTASKENAKLLAARSRRLSIVTEEAGDSADTSVVSVLDVSASSLGGSAHLDAGGSELKQIVPLSPRSPGKRSSSRRSSVGSSKRGKVEQHFKENARHLVNMKEQVDDLMARALKTNVGKGVTMLEISGLFRNSKTPAEDVISAYRGLSKSNQAKFKQHVVRQAKKEESTERDQAILKGISS